MKDRLTRTVLLSALMLPVLPAGASQQIENMSNSEVTEYAIRMSEVLDEIQRRQLCRQQDESCIRAHFASHGIEYDDREAVNKRLHLMIGSFY